MTSSGTDLSDRGMAPTPIATELSQLIPERFHSIRLLRDLPGISASVRMQGEDGETFFANLRVVGGDVDPARLATSATRSRVLIGYSVIELITRPGYQLLLTVRPYTARMLSDSPIYSDHGYGKYRAISPRQALRRVHVLRDVLSGLGELHAIGIPHRDLRPSNISVTDTGAALVDIGLTSALQTLEDSQLKYVAPEIRLGAVAAPSSDIFAAGQLMNQLLLGHFSPEKIIPLTGARAGELRWLAALAMSEDPDRRPDAVHMWEVLFGESALSVSMATNLVREAGYGLVKSVQDSGVGPLAWRELASMAQSQVELHLLEKPLTSLHIQTPERAVAMLSVVQIEDLDELKPQVHSNVHDGHKDVSAEYYRQTNDDIDDEWKRRLALDYVDVVPEIGDSATLEEVIDYLPSDLAELFTDEVNFARRVRERLLAGDGFFSEAALSRLMSRSAANIVPSDIDVMREWGLLLGVRDHGEWVYPHFQFDPSNGSPFSIVRKVQNEVAEGENSWTLLSWWMSPNKNLKGLQPRQLLGEPDSDALLLEAIKIAVS